MVPLYPRSTSSAGRRSSFRRSADWLAERPGAIRPDLADHDERAVMVTIKLGLTTATVEHGVWTCDDQLFVESLELLDFEPSGYTPDLDWAMANAAVTELGATIVAGAPPAATVPGRVY